ncbi:MAG: D-sedoheptulose-7-phosphate isomerase [Bryobacteraceae bacterium]
MDRRGIGNLFREVSLTFQTLAESDYDVSVARAAELISAAFENGHKLLVFGNGGSAADAQHICGELVGRFLLERPGLPAIALTANSAVLTAWANDYNYETIFSRQIEALGTPGDVAWGISTSGNSKNVVQGLLTARSAGLRTMGMTGAQGGRVAFLSDVPLCAPATLTPRIQEVHLVTYHAICAAVEEQLAHRIHERAATAIG